MSDRKPTPSLFDALEAGITSAEACSDAAARRGWDAEGAAEFVLAYLRTHGPTAGEVLVDKASERYAPHDGRAFGSVFLRLKRRGLIETCGFVRRAKGHGSPGLVWQLASRSEGAA